jgi:hypothetical protein
LRREELAIEIDCGSGDEWIRGESRTIRSFELRLLRHRRYRAFILGYPSVRKMFDAVEMAIESVEEAVELGFDPGGERRMDDDVFIVNNQGFTGCHVERIEILTYSLANYLA